MTAYTITRYANGETVDTVTASAESNVAQVLREYAHAMIAADALLDRPAGLRAYFRAEERADKIAGGIIYPETVTVWLHQDQRDGKRVEVRKAD